MKNIYSLKEIQIFFNDFCLHDYIQKGKHQNVKSKNRTAFERTNITIECVLAFNTLNKKYTRII